VVTSTFLVTLFAPLFFVWIEKTLGKHRRSPDIISASPAAPEHP
jgi:hypothetical protein